MGKFNKEQVKACYYAYLSRPGPCNLGTVEWPEAKPGCLSGMKFLVTGILETITREDAVGLLRECGGHVMSGMSKNLNYLIVGRDAGPRKLENAEEWGITQLSEEQFFNFIKEKIDNHDPSIVNNEVKEKAKKKKMPMNKSKSLQSLKKKKEFKKATIVDVDEKPKLADIKPKALRGHGRIKDEIRESGEAKKRTKIGKSSNSQLKIKNEPVSDVEESSMIETKDFKTWKTNVLKKRSVKKI